MNIIFSHEAQALIKTHPFVTWGALTVIFALAILVPINLGLKIKNR